MFVLEFLVLGFWVMSGEIDREMGVIIKRKFIENRMQRENPKTNMVDQF